MIKLILLAQVVAGMMYGGPAPSPMDPNQVAMINRIKAQEAIILTYKAIPDDINKLHRAVVSCYKFMDNGPGHCSKELNALDSALASNKP